jgi:hypothetical protein
MLASRCMLIIKAKKNLKPNRAAREINLNEIDCDVTDLIPNLLILLSFDFVIRKEVNIFCFNFEMGYTEYRYRLA